ncbi:hypothetical protein E8E78_24650 [Pseudomonas sp. BN505]|nr:hypothetical protein [Salmonella enterica subsp. enterica serovar Enteritidis]MDH4843967.1 hypothetical protein [Pseudomonas sp. BN605]MDH4859746.1 hypothetical protein [Pseudomonas sp. BN505]
MSRARKASWRSSSTRSPTSSTTGTCTPCKKTPPTRAAFFIPDRAACFAGKPAPTGIAQHSVLVGAGLPAKRPAQAYRGFSKIFELRW